MSADQEAAELDRELWGGDPVHVALAKVMADVQAVGKDEQNKSQGWSFRGVDAVVNAVGPALRRHGVIVIPRILSTSYKDFTTANGKSSHECIVEVEYTFVGPDGTTLVGSSIGESADYGDKATAQAMSVAYRTWWLQALCIPTDEPDPDETIVVRGEAEQIPSAECKTRLIAASTKDIAKQLWGDRPDEPVSIVVLDALVDVAKGMAAHDAKKAAAAGEES